MQKMKSRCTGTIGFILCLFCATSIQVYDMPLFICFSDLEKEVEALKQQSKSNNSSSDDSSLIQVCVSDKGLSVNMQLLIHVKSRNLCVCV